MILTLPQVGEIWTTGWTNYTIIGKYLKAIGKDWDEIIDLKYDNNRPSFFRAKNFVRCIISGTWYKI